MNSRLQNIHILCNMERRKETGICWKQKAPPPKKKVYSVEYTLCNMGRVNLLGVTVL